MERFFGSKATLWPRLDSRLHIYLNPPPDSAITQAMQKASEALSGYPELAVQPAKYFHATVQQLSFYEEDHQFLSRLKKSLQELAGELLCFDLLFTQPTARNYAVETIAQPHLLWSKLVEGVRNVALKTGDVALPEAPFGPHMTVRYAVDFCDDQAVNNSLEQVKNSFPVAYQVDGFDLVSVTQNVKAGTFTFDILERFKLPR